MRNAQGGPQRQEAGQMLEELGAQVRTVRKAAGLTRADLAAASGVSLRYLAQLEAGAGNISVALLSRVAAALGQHPAGLLAGRQSRDVATLFETAPVVVQDKVLALLSPDGSAPKAGRLCLVGLRGAGKSTLGAGLGARLGLPFLELNALIEEGAGMPLAEIIGLYGIAGYRRFEAEALDRVIAEYDDVVLAVAGGIVAEPETYTRLLARFHSIWIRATPEAHMNRVLAQGDTRPMEGNPAALDRIRAILEERGPDYARADATLDTSIGDQATSLAALARLVATRDMICTK